MKKTVEHYTGEYWSFGLAIQNPYGDDLGNENYCQLVIQLFKHSWYIRVPELFKPRHEWVDLSREEWATPDRNGVKGYDKYTRREYGFILTPECVHVRYGIQPGQWTRDDPENSDHSLVFWYPWQLTIVRHDLLYPDGSIYHRNLYPRKDQTHLHWYEVFDGHTKINTGAEVKVAEYVDLEHYNKTDGKLQRAHIRLTGEEREWRPKCTRWLPIFRYIKRTVDCDSDTQLGTRAGSWKGGMMGWSTEWRKDESMKAAFGRWYKKWNGE